MAICYPGKRLPVLKTCDLVIEGSSLYACSAALEHARRGESVVLVDSRTYLGWEMTACLRPWMSSVALANDPNLPVIIGEVLTQPCWREWGDEIIFSMDRLKLALEDCLLNAGVQILYASRVAETLRDEDRLTGVVLANKSCRQVIRCGCYLNFQPDAVPQFWADAGPIAPHRLAWRTLEFTHLDLENVSRLPLPDLPGIPRQGVFRLHRGFFSERHWLVEFPVAVEELCQGDDEADLDFLLQELSMKTVRHLLQNIPEFSGAAWVGASFETPWAHDGHFAPIAPSHQTCQRAATAALEQNQTPPPFFVSEIDAFADLTSEYCEVPGSALPVEPAVDVLVVGGGTSGVAAALSAAEYGLETLVIEMNPRVGGTGTLGGVQSYWFGRDSGFTAQWMQRLKQAHRDLRQPEPAGDIPRWNIDVKAWTQLEMLHGRQVRVRFNSRVVGTVVQDGVILGAVISSPHGLSAVTARVVIDASGDGDAAVFSGAPFASGSDRNRSTMWYSLAQFAAPGQTKNNFTSMVEIGNVLDYTRAILAGRRRGQNPADHGIYLCTRESRSVLGDTTISLTDQLKQKHFDDVIALAFSNHDVKGHTDSDWLRAGLIPPNLELEIPLRALLPRDLEHLLVVGKAISAAHDALPSIRMQRDVETVGAAAGVIAALACQRDCALRAVPLGLIQAELVQRDLLPAAVLAREPEQPGMDIEEALDQLGQVYPLYTYSDMGMQDVFHGKIPFVELSTSAENHLPLLAGELRGSSGARRLLLAQVLAMKGAHQGVETLIAAIQSWLGAAGLPERQSAIRNTQLPPDQGAMPDVVYWLYSLAMAGDESAIPTWTQLANKLQTAAVDDFYSHSKGIFYYIDALCLAAERLGSPRAAGFLRSAAAIPFLRGQVCREPFQVDFVKERIAFLELSLARAMVLCGLPDGIPTLIEYLQDTRAPLRLHAHSILVRLAGADFKADQDAWTAWFRASGAQ